MQQAATAAFQTSATTKDKLIAFELIPETILDVAGGFQYIAIQTSASNAGNVTSAELFVLGQSQGANPPTTYT